MRRIIAAIALTVITTVTIAGPAGALNDIGGGGSSCRQWWVTWYGTHPVFTCIRWR